MATKREKENGEEAAEHAAAGITKRATNGNRTIMVGTMRIVAEATVAQTMLAPTTQTIALTPDSPMEAEASLGAGAENAVITERFPPT